MNKKLPVTSKVDTGKPKYFKVRVKSHDGDKLKITLPWSLISLLTRFVPENTKDIDIDEVVKQVEELGMKGEIVDIKTKDGDTIRIFVE